MEVKTKARGKKFSSPETIYLTGNEIIFSKGKAGKSHSLLKDGKLLPVMGLYSGTVTDGRVSNIAELPLNAADYSNSHPSISKDGKTLYFASDRLGGQGGTDLYVSTQLSNGTWSSPTNLGPALNSVFDEKFPFIADDGTFYFSSNAPNG